MTKLFYYHEGLSKIGRANVPKPCYHKGLCITGIMGVCCSLLRGRVSVTSKSGNCPQRRKEHPEKTACKRLAGFGCSSRKVVSKSSLSLIIIYYNTKNHTPWGEDPQTLPH